MPAKRKKKLLDAIKVQETKLDPLNVLDDSKSIISDHEDRIAELEYELKKLKDFVDQIHVRTA